ncbi:hypothetical protein ABFS83_04G070000 [Erythranthe nasuta]
MCCVVLQRMQTVCFVLMLLLLVLELTVGESDIDALLQLRRGIHTDNSVEVLASWDSNSLASDGCPKNWYGIACSSGRVTSIVLNDLGLIGEFDFLAVSSLQMLKNLSLSGNQFSGAITKEIGSIQSLQNLDVSRNSFAGSVPSELAALENLVALNVSSNEMVGEIPTGFGSLKKLKFLDFHSNGFVGDVMRILGQLGDVAYVDLSVNRFSGSLDLGAGNPDFISSVNYLNVSHNNLSGELFPHDGIPYFDSLEVFDASYNGFLGNIPSFSFVVSLRVIKLGNNQLSGSLPEGLLQESSMILSELDLSHNWIEGPIGSISSENLRNLNLSSNRLSGPLPIRIGHCAVIDLSNNMFSGNISRIQSWGNYIEIIDLSSNELTGSLPNQTSQFLRLTSLRISNNSLEGILTPVLGTYPELENVDFSLNKLTGSLPPTLFTSTKLTDVNLSSNNFSGTIPISDAAGPPQNYSLASLDLSNNELTGILPNELGRFRSIVFLDLSKNLLEGGIPDDLSETMKGFNVSYNNLSGVVPQSLQRFTSSSFRPGNYYLTLPNEASSTKGGNNISLKGHNSRLKSAIRAALIAGLVGGVSVIVILTLMIYCRVNREGNKSTPRETGGKKVLSSAGVESAAQSGDVLPAVTSPKDTESRMKTEILTSENNAPEKLAGDLNIFDSSLKLTPEELSSAPAEAIGMSCHGTLYKAVLPSGQVLAVKLLKEGIAKGRKEFAREAKKLGNIRHPNLVSLQGFYWGPREHEKLIISKYVDAPCLALYLHDSAGPTDSRTTPPLSLADRLKIAVDVSGCLTYLHTESTIPHGNLKSTNILIEFPDINVLLTDYTLHRLLTPSGISEQVLNAAALGYLPPEFTTTSKPCPSLKSDVYAFGVVLLELLTGRSSADIIPGTHEVVDLSEWVGSMAAEDRAFECIDRAFVGPQQVVTESVGRNLDLMLCVALKCVLPADERPDMKVVFEELSCVVL